MFWRGGCDLLVAEIGFSGCVYVIVGFLGVAVEV